MAGGHRGGRRRGVVGVVGDGGGGGWTTGTMEESWGGLFDDQYMDPNPVAARPGACEPTERVTRQRQRVTAQVISCRHHASQSPSPARSAIHGRLPAFSGAHTI